MNKKKEILKNFYHFQRNKNMNGQQLNLGLSNNDTLYKHNDIAVIRISIEIKPKEYDTLTPYEIGINDVIDINSIIERYKKENIISIGIKKRLKYTDNYTIDLIEVKNNIISNTTTTYYMNKLQVTKDEFSFQK